LVSKQDVDFPWARRTGKKKEASSSPLFFFNIPCEFLPIEVEGNKAEGRRNKRH
jgi:hypothetical protein